MNSAAGGSRGVYMQYFVGEFDGKTFVNDNAADKVLTVDYGDCFYAAIPWNNLPGDGKVLIGWMVPRPARTAPWTGQMSISRDLSLKRTAWGYRMLQEPAGIVRKALPAAGFTEMKGVKVTNGEMALDKLQGNAYWLDADWDPGTATMVGFKIASETVVGYDRAKHELYVDKGAGMKRQVVDLTGSGFGDKIRLRVLFDKSSLEVFVNDGEQVLTTYIYPDGGAGGCSVFAEGGTATVRSMKIWDLSKL